MYTCLPKAAKTCKLGWIGNREGNIVTYIFKISITNVFFNFIIKFIFVNKFFQGSQYCEIV